MVGLREGEGERGLRRSIEGREADEFVQRDVLPPLRSLSLDLLDS